MNDQIGEIVEAWNAHSPVLPKCLMISDKRHIKLMARLREPFFVENWREALSRVRASSFCCGGNDRGWKSDFDWFLQPDVVLKIMEGKYDNREVGKAATGAMALVLAGEELKRVEARIKQLSAEASQDAFGTKYTECQRQERQKLRCRKQDLVKQLGFAV